MRPSAGIFLLLVFLILWALAGPVLAFVVLLILLAVAVIRR